MEQIIHGDCLEELRKLSNDSIESLCTDPPAGISFMNKEWDSHKGGRLEWIAWMSSVMKECLRVLKPGAHGLVWALPRTSHWTASALEDAGFEVRDCIYHIFGSGFPKSLDISKAIDKEAGAERKVIGKSANWRPAKTKGGAGFDKAVGSGPTEMGITAPATDSAKLWQGFGTALKPAVECWWLVRKKSDSLPEWLLSARSAEKNSKPIHAELGAVTERLAQLSVIIKRAAEEIENLARSGREASGFAGMDMLLSALKEADTDLSIVWSWNNTSGADLSVAKTCITLMELRQTIESKILSFYPLQNTQLDTMAPDVNCAWLIRKPISEKTVAKNVLKWGVGGLNIDGSRIETNEKLSFGSRELGDGIKYGKCTPTTDGIQNPQGRFPSHLILDEEAGEMLDEQSGPCKTGEIKPHNINYESEVKFNYSKKITSHFRPDAASGASRFFYCAKTSKSERNAGLEGMPEQMLATSTGQTRPNKPARLGADPSAVQSPVANHHPTVKPQKLMRYLIKLITPPNGTVLDPFMGSGSTGVAAKAEGFGFVGVEREAEYFEIAKKRVEWNSK